MKEKETGVINAQNGENEPKAEISYRVKELNGPIA